MARPEHSLEKSPLGGLTVAARARSIMSAEPSSCRARPSRRAAEPPIRRADEPPSRRACRSAEPPSRRAADEEPEPPATSRTGAWRKLLRRPPSPPDATRGATVAPARRLRTRLHNPSRRALASPQPLAIFRRRAAARGAPLRLRRRRPADGQRRRLAYTDASGTGRWFRRARGAKFRLMHHLGEAQCDLDESASTTASFRRRRGRAHRSSCCLRAVPSALGDRHGAARADDVR